MTSDYSGAGPDVWSGSTRRVPSLSRCSRRPSPCSWPPSTNLVITNALPVIRTDLGASVEQTLQWFVNAYTLTFATLMLGASTLGDRFGRRRVFVAGISLFTLASIASALATTPAMLIASQGVGGAAIMPLSLTLLAVLRCPPPSGPWRSGSGVASPGSVSRSGH